MKNEVLREVERVVLTLDVNGEISALLVPVHKTLLEVLREDMQLTGTKHGCELGECGTCTVLVDGKPELSCLLLPVQLEGRAITTIEGMARGSELHPLQAAFAELGAAQCGYCTPGILLSARSLLETNPSPSRHEIREALAGNLCRCTGYTKIVEAVELAASSPFMGRWRAAPERLLLPIHGEVARSAGEATPPHSWGGGAQRRRG
jgi:aerobic-type carbon monoxide dehydrogenase small subunit (CoxS/CutS family)